MKKGMQVRAALLLAGLVLAAGCAQGPGGAAREMGSSLPKLVSADVAEREEARQALLEGGAAAVSALTDCAMGEGEMALRKAAVEELGVIGRVGTDGQVAAQESLARIYMANDPATVGTAAAAARAVGAAMLPHLAKAAAAVPLETQPAPMPPAWRHALIMMLMIDRQATIATLVGLLGDSAYAAHEATIINALGTLAGQSFPYDPKGSPETRQVTVAKWQEWLKAQPH